MTVMYTEKLENPTKSVTRNWFVILSREILRCSQESPVYLYIHLHSNTKGKQSVDSKVSLYLILKVTKTSIPKPFP